MNAGEMTLTSMQFAFIGQVIAVGAVLWGLWKSVAAAADKQAPVIAAVRAELYAKIDAEVAQASKSRHDMANSLQAQLSRIEQDVERLKREAVSKADLTAIENRLSTMFAKVEGKVDALNDRLLPLLALEKQVQSIDNRLAEALRRIEHFGLKQTPAGGD